jgi:FdrA protein
MSGVVLNAGRRSLYLDSVALMRLSQRISQLPGVIEAALMMATPANKQILQGAGLLEDGATAAPNDLLIAVRANTETEARAAMDQATAELDKPRTPVPSVAEAQARSLRAALRRMPDASLALISVPGEYAVSEARAALAAGLDVMIFSDNVAIEDEAALKREARQRGRLVMGPDCGTAIIDGAPIAFANRVPRGDIGLIGASGTGMQEVSSLLAQMGHGISQGIGVGGRDLHPEVGGISTLMAIDRLDADPGTRHIVLVSKPPHPEVANAVLARVAESQKPFTICYLGAEDLQVPLNARAAATLREAAEIVIGGEIISPRRTSALPALRPGVIVGLYSGGTLCAEAQLVLRRAGRRVASNAPAPGVDRLSADSILADRLLDLGADEFTRGRPHPMIEPSVRDDLLRQTLADESIAVVLLDVVLGYGAHADPAGHVAAVLERCTSRHPYVVASVTGTDDDPQVRSEQVAKLEQAGALVTPSNAQAAEWAVALSRA